MRKLFESFLSQEYVALDTETTGLCPHKDDKAFAISIAIPGEEYYFEVTDELVGCLIFFFSSYTGTIFMHNAKFDMGFFDKLGCRVEIPQIHCTMAHGRLKDSDAFSLSLANLGKDIGYLKDDAVKIYLEKNKLFEWVERPGKKKRVKNYFYNLVPREVMEPYAKQDAKVTLQLGLTQIAHSKENDYLPLSKNEMRLTQTFYRMEKVGIKIDRNFVERAWEYEKGLCNKAQEAFKEMSAGIDFVDHHYTLEKAFRDSGEVLQKTDKGNYSFDDDVLSSMKHPLAKVVQNYRKAHVRANTYESMLYYADSNDILHATAWQCGCKTGRVSYSDPPLQCMEKVEKDDPSYKDEFLIRRSFVPRPGFFFVMMDFDQFEYRMMANYAKQWDLIEKVKGGLDVHTATAELMGVTRKQAKTINFMLLYGGGYEKLANALGIQKNEAYQLREKYFSKLPKVKQWVDAVNAKVKQTGTVKNWFGRQYKLPKELSYKAPNYIIQGGCADWVKIAMNNISGFLKGSGARSRILLQIHDELLLEIDELEKHLIPYIKEIMETAASTHPTHSNLPYTVGVDFSYKSWQDKEEWK